MGVPPAEFEVAPKSHFHTPQQFRRTPLHFRRAAEFRRCTPELGWSLLARENHSPYVDNRPLLVAGKPEIRKYKGLFVVGRDEIGLESDVVEATARA
ncbi:MAG: hypothetical protein ABJC04_10545 [Verrucomicrobiota bacterium]